MQISEETKNKIIELYVNTHKKISKILQEVAPDEKISLEEFYDILREYSDNNPDKSMSRQIKDSKILELLDNGLTLTQIKDELGVSIETISQRIKKMRSQGVEIPEKIKTENTENDKKILELLEKGLTQTQIKEELGVSNKNILQRIKKMRSQGIVIPNKKKTESEENDRKILELLKKGLNQSEIAEQLNLSRDKVFRNINKMRGRGIEIPKREKKENDERDNKILELLEKGFSRKEIVEKMGISKQSISKRIIQMEERGVEIPKKKKKKIESTGADIARGVIDLMDKKGASEEQVRTIAEIYGVDEEVEDLLKCIDEKER